MDPITISTMSNAIGHLVDTGVHLAATSKDRSQPESGNDFELGLADACLRNCLVFGLVLL